MSSNCLVFHTSGLPYFIKPCGFSIFNFLSTESSSSRVNGPGLMSNCLLILVIGSYVNFGGFPSRFSKCCFYSSCWLLAFSLVLVVLTSPIVCHAILDCLFSTESLILSIWFCMYSVCSFRYMFTNSFCTFFNFRAFVLVGFFLLHLEAIFTSARFSLTANVYHRTLDFVLCFIGMCFAAASKWA